MAQLIHHFKQSQFNNSTGFTAQTPASFNLFCLNHLVGEAQPGRLLALHFVLPAQPCHQGLTSGDHILCPLTPPLSCADIQLRELCIIQKIHFSWGCTDWNCCRDAANKAQTGNTTCSSQQGAQHLKQASSLLGWEFYSWILQCVSPEWFD